MLRKHLPYIVRVRNEFNRAFSTEIRNCKILSSPAALVLAEHSKEEGFEVFYAGRLQRKFRRNQSQ